MISSFAAFYLRWGEVEGWQVPDEHLLACDWIENRPGRVAVFKAHRGFSKSTIGGRYVPWKLRQRPNWRFQVLSANDADAAKMSRDARSVIDRHPWCAGMRPQRGGLWKTHRFEVTDASDPRNPSVSAYGVMSNITGGRADECINDDCEVPKTIRTPALRESLRERLSEQTHIIVPGGKILYIGTDHCVESIYREQIEDGADLLEIPLFRREITHIAKRLEQEFTFDWRVQKESDLFVVVGGLRPRLLEVGDYLVDGLRDFRGGRIRLRGPVSPEERVSIYSVPTWPTRFTRDEIKFRIGRCRSWGEFDSQYQLHAARIGDVRLDPHRMIEYTDEPEFRQVNGELTCWINSLRMVGVSAVWDNSLGKITSDASAFCIVFTDARGYLFWQVAEDLQGDIDEQCQQVVKLVKRYRLPKVTVKTAGVGGHVPAILKGHLRRSRLHCAVGEQPEQTKKNIRILDGLEPPLSGLYLYAHQAVKQGPAAKQMAEWDPKVLDQPDDYLDTVAGCIAETPIRIGRAAPPETPPPDDWRPGMESVELEMEFNRR